MSERPTPETDAIVLADINCVEGWHRLRDFARRLERQRDEAMALVRQHRSEFLGEIQARVIALGGNPPPWPARNDIEAHDDVESAARMIMELLQKDVDR